MLLTVVSACAVSLHELYLGSSAVEVVRHCQHISVSSEHKLVNLKRAEMFL
jgi:hypothetical protein